MKYSPPTRARALKKSVLPQSSPLQLAQEVGSVSLLVQDLRALREDVIATTNRELEKVDEKLAEVDSKVEQVLEIKQGPAGVDADEQKIADWVLSQIYVPKDGTDGKDADEDKILSKLAKMVPKSDDIAKEVLRRIPENKASLKVIQEKIEIDPEVLMGHLERLAPEIKKKFGIDDLDKLTKILDRRYIHGGGDTVAAGSGITITTNSNGTKVISSAGGAGTVTSVSVTTANGVSGSVATATTTPAITLTLGDITPTSIVASGTISGSNLSGTNTGDQTSVSGNAGTVTVADAGGDTTMFPLLGTDATGNLSPRTDAGLTYNATTNELTTTTFVGALTGTASGNPTASSTTTLSNKRITKRVLALSAGSATPSINTDLYDVVHITAQSAAINTFTTNLSGTPVDGDTLRISITDNGTARALTWGASFESSTATLPTTTVISTRLDVGFFWNTETTKWRCVATA